MFRAIGIPFLAILLTVGGKPASRTFDDEMIHLEIPTAWHVEGEAGEYFLESDDQDVASIMVLPPDSESTLEERLAEIEEQFLGTGIIELETSEARTHDGDPISYRRYRLMLAGAEDEESNWILLHQYSFWRNETRLLLQVETIPGREAHEELFEAVFGSLEVRAAPEPFLFEDPAFSEVPDSADAVPTPE